MLAVLSGCRGFVGGLDDSNVETSQIVFINTSPYDLTFIIDDEDWVGPDTVKIESEGGLKKYDIDLTLDAVKALQADGYIVYAIEQAHGSTMLSNLQLPQNQKTAIIMGHEVFGVQQEVVDAANGCIEIPQYGTKHSLNVSVTAGIVMYQLSNMLR